MFQYPTAWNHLTICEDRPVVAVEEIWRVYPKAHPEQTIPPSYPYPYPIPCPTVMVHSSVDLMRFGALHDGMKPFPRPRTEFQNSGVI